MEKYIAYPTYSNLLLKALQKMIKLMQDNGLNIHQSYASKAPRLTQQIGRYDHARQFRRSQDLKKFSSAVGLIMRELQQ